MDAASPNCGEAKQQKGDDALVSQTEKAMAFRALHERPGAFIIPNPWDPGTARLLAALGFEAIATTSLGLANMLGRADSAVTRSEVLAPCCRLSRSARSRCP
jgi:2-methylisocitrate lyase-like PEP mutase family enzyme